MFQVASDLKPKSGQGQGCFGAVQDASFIQTPFTSSGLRFGSSWWHNGCCYGCRHLIEAKNVWQRGMSLPCIYQGRNPLLESLAATLTHPIAWIGSHAYDMARRRRWVGWERQRAGRFLHQRRHLEEEDEVAREWLLDKPTLLSAIITQSPLSFLRCSCSHRTIWQMTV